MEQVWHTLAHEVSYLLTAAHFPETVVRGPQRDPLSGSRRQGWSVAALPGVGVVVTAHLYAGSWVYVGTPHYVPSPLDPAVVCDWLTQYQAALAVHGLTSTIRHFGVPDLLLADPTLPPAYVLHPDWHPASPVHP